jgi:hypothetical protein
MDRKTPEYWADWLVDAVATATQDRRYLRGDEDEDTIATQAIYLNGKKAIENLLRERALVSPRNQGEA